jgi:hypothetical protein
MGGVYHDPQAASQAAVMMEEFIFFLSFRECCRWRDQGPLG